MRRHRRQRGRHAACGSNPRAAGRAAALPRLLKPARCARGPRDKARRASSPPVLGSRCGGTCCASSHNGLLPPTAAVARKLAWCGSASLRYAPFGWAATPVMSCAPSRLRQRRQVRPRCLEHRSSCGHGFAVAAGTIARRAARAEQRRAPPPTRPVSRGGVAPLARRSLPAASARPPVRPARRGLPEQPNSRTRPLCGASRRLGSHRIGTAY